MVREFTGGGGVLQPQHGNSLGLPEVSPVQAVIQRIADRMPIKSKATEDFVVSDLQWLHERDSLIGRMAHVRVFHPGDRKDTIAGRIKLAEFTQRGVWLNFDVRGIGYLVLDGSGAYNQGYSVDLTLEE